MYDTLLLNFILALATNELLHNIAEINGIRGKLKRLHAHINNQPYKEMKININTRLKSYGIAFVIFLFATTLLFAFYTWLDLSLQNSMYVIFGMLIASFASTSVLVDKFHVEIETVTRPFMKKPKV